MFWAEEVKGFLCNHLGECKTLVEWKKDIHQCISRTNHLTSRQIGHIFGVIKRKKWYEVQRKDRPIRYSFF